MKGKNDGLSECELARTSLVILSRFLTLLDMYSSLFL
jgi:hypothetical protein